VETLESYHAVERRRFAISDEGCHNLQNPPSTPLDRVVEGRPQLRLMIFSQQVSRSRAKSMAEKGSFCLRAVVK
jgi:hypothetical protein